MTTGVWHKSTQKFQKVRWNRVSDLQCLESDDDMNHKRLPASSTFLTDILQSRVSIDISVKRVVVLLCGDIPRQVR